MKRHLEVVVAIFSHISFFSIFVSLLAILSICTVNLYDTSSEKEVQTFEYKYFHSNSLTNKSSVGFLTMTKEIGENENLYSKEENGNRFLISPLGSEEYHCIGSCYCERRSATVAKKGLTFLASAVSSFLAYSKAKEYFEKECSASVNMNCPSSEISSEVDDCEPLFEYLDKEFQRKQKELENLPDIRKYYCRGNCVPSKQLKTVFSIKLGNRICPRLKREGEVEVNTGKGQLPSKLRGIRNKQAIDKFQKEFMVPYCKGNERSRVKYFYKYPHGKGGQWKRITVCVGSTHPINPSIHCIQTDPPVDRTERGGNYKYW